MARRFNTKPMFQRCLRPAVRVFAAAGITPNQVTLTTILLSLASGGLIAIRPEAGWPLLLVPAVLSLRVAFNHVDGMLACEYDMRTPLGAILNELADVVSDAALYLPFALVPGMPAILLVPVVVLGLLTEMIGVVATQIGADRREEGPMGKKARGLVISGAALAIGLGVEPGAWLHGVLVATLPLQLMTIFNRADCALKQVAGRCLEA